jgi:hypothetical protein
VQPIGITAPRLLAWFYGFAGSHPETILNDSNRDWGHDVVRVARILRTLNIANITTSLATTADLDGIGLRLHTNLEAALN